MAQRARCDLGVPGKIVDSARKLSSAKSAVLSRFDADAMLVHTVAVSPGASAPAHAARAAWPSQMRVDANPHLRRLYLQGQHVTAPLRVMLGCAKPLRPPARAPRLTQYVTMLPLRTGQGIVGSLSFISPRKPKISRLRVYANLARFASCVTELSQAGGECLGADERTRKEAAAVLHGTHAALIALQHRLAESRTVLANAPAQAAAILDGVREELERIGEGDIAGTSRLLYPLTIRMSLTPALKALTEQFQPRVKTALRIDKAVTDLDDPFRNRLPEALRLAVYRAVESLLTRAAGCDPAPQLDIRLNRAAGPMLVLTLSLRHGIGGRGAAGKRQADAVHRWSDLGSLLFRLHNGGALPTISTTRNGRTTLSASFLLPQPEEAGQHPIPQNPA